MEDRNTSIDDLYSRESKDYDSRTVKAGEGGNYLRLKIFLKEGFSELSMQGIDRQEFFVILNHEKILGNNHHRN